MSSLTGSRRTYVAPRGGLRRRVRRISIPIPAESGPALALGLAAAIMASAFVARGGSQLERTTWTEVGLMLGGAALAALALVLPRRAGTPERLRGVWALTAFALLAAFTTASLNWSLTPDDSWQESSRTLAYLATMVAGAALARLAPRRWSALLGGVLLGSLVIVGWALLTKVFPAALARDEPFARLRPPFDYWNSVGLAAALMILPLLWLAVRRSGHAAINALAWPALGLAIVCMLLSYSRGALLATGIALALWLAIVPLRLASVVVIGAVTAVTVPVVAWAFAQDGLTLDNPPLALRVDAGLELGALLLLLIVALLVAGLAVGFLSAHHPPGERMRARASRVLVGALVVVPAVAILMLANAPGGIDGQVSKAWKQATDPTANTPSNTPSRLTATSSVRSRYWREALDVHARNPWLGGGAGSYGTLRLRYRKNDIAVRHAHGYVVQTLADLGWAGLALSLLATFAWLWAAARTLGLRRRDRGLPWDAERVAMAAAAGVVIVFGVHSAVDWTWFVPGNIVPALLCAGWVAARGPLRERLSPLPAEPERVRNAGPLAAGALVAAVGVVAAYSAIQPVRAVHAENASYQRLAEGQLPQAISIARVAHERDPLALDPLFDIAALEQQRGNNTAARSELEAAVHLEPANPEPWRRLGEFRRKALHDPKSALEAYQAAYFLDPHSVQSVEDLVVVSREAAK
ncbi:O-antigen ligase family protein [Candidatus Solirubrobacter pratensis]|uniref:O-antigen ligase family protein n=1 Tax=Candidatus Solirubrobacter pratensis TaxID=1298857 RepID=UPI0003FE0392|nr:O-antigen ligase family protein [Candidatus Solirubrobacter pratensis]